MMLVSGFYGLLVSADIKTNFDLRKHVFKCPYVNPAPSKNNRETPRFSFCPECSLGAKEDTFLNHSGW